MMHMLKLFFELNNSIYSVICSSQQVNINRVIKLIGAKNINKVRSEFIFPEDFFNWFFINSVNASDS